MSELKLPPHVLTGIDSPVRESRLTGVDELTRIATGADLAMASAARMALTRLAQDDSRSVATAAAAALERTAVRLHPDQIDFGPVPPGAPLMVADVLVVGPPLAIAGATVTVSGPGLHATLAGRHLRVEWQPHSHWLDGLVTVRGQAGWADVSVSGQVKSGAPMPRPAVEAPLRPAPVPLPPAPPRSRRGRTVVIAGVTTLVLLAGAGVAWVLTNQDRQPDRTATALINPPASATEPAASQAAPAPAPVSRVPLAQRVASMGKPSVVGTIKVGTEPEGVAVSPDSKTLYVANQGSRVLSVVTTASKRVKSVPLRNTPRFVTTSRDGDLVFISMYENDKSGSGVAVVDAATLKVIRYLPTGVQPYALSVGPDGRVWVPIHSQGRVEIYTAGDQRPQGRITVPPNPHAVGFSASQQRAFTPNHESNVVTVIDMKTDKVLKSIPVSQAPHSLAVSPDGKRVLVAGFEANTADLIDAQTLRRTGPFKVGNQPQSVAFATDGAHGYIVNEGDNTVSVLDGKTGAVTATIKVGGSPRTVAVSPDGRMAYISNGTDNTISVLRVGN
jgi:YVTN family beta-propeller protein